jgi:uncharacterized membrane protein
MILPSRSQQFCHREPKDARSIMHAEDARECPSTGSFRVAGKPIETASTIQETFLGFDEVRVEWPVAPFYSLIAFFALFWIAGFAGAAVVWPWSAALRAALAIMFLVTASAHWGKKRSDLIRMVPPAFPKPELLVTATGCFEIAGAIGLLLPATARLAATCLALLMAAMFPANVYASRQMLSIGGRPVTPFPIRTAVQLVFVAALLVAGLVR